MRTTSITIILVVFAICDLNAQSALSVGATNASASGKILTASVGQNFVGLSGASGKNVGSGFWYTITQSLVSTDLETIDGIAGDFALRDNYPNPFNPETTFSFVLASQSPTTLIVYDMLGNEVERIVDQVLPAGEFRTSWTADGMASGTYFYRLESGSLVQTKKMVLMK